MNLRSRDQVRIFRFSVYERIKMGEMAEIEKEFPLLDRRTENLK